MEMIVPDYDAVTFTMCMKCGREDTARHTMRNTSEIICVKCDLNGVWRTTEKPLVTTAYIMGFREAKNG